MAAPPNKDDLKGPIEIAALGSFPLSAGQARQLDVKISTLEAALPGHSTNQQAWGYRALAHVQLRLGRFDQCLAVLEKAAKHQTNPESYALFIRAAGLHQLGRRDEARAAFDQAEAIMTPLLMGASGQFDAFLHPGQIYQQLLMHRETKTLLGLK